MLDGFHVYIALSLNNTSPPVQLIDILDLKIPITLSAQIIIGQSSRCMETNNIK